MNTVNDKLKKSCEEAIVAFQKLNNEEYNEIQSKLEWCLGSYDYDRNPSGLHEYGVVTLQALRDIKKDNPRKVNKKVIEGLEKSILSYETALN